MEAQSEIQRTLSSSTALAAVARILEQEEFTSRHAVGRRICAEFDFHDHRGRPQVAGCLKALRGQQQGQPIVLPPAGRTPSCAGQPAPLPWRRALARS